MNLTKAKRQPEQHHSDSEEVATSQTNIKAKQSNLTKRERNSERSRNGVAVDDTDVRGGSRGSLGLHLNPSCSQALEESIRVVDIYWKNEHRLSCTSEICTAAERDRYEKSTFFVFGYLRMRVKQGFVLVEIFWCLVRICKYYKDIQNLEEVEKRCKEE
ncbi:B-cell receptor-associated 31-like protein [Prunus dulcis]|uniref:B-cell receptor-associated 31-like protein n=1 Tax=Prunus dulcis TaxID=3755 RepID=A0A4Y1RJZ7_PRUDU|nr:B-cell receptor-associated 31-like protein [Prunus dulcis]